MLNNFIYAQTKDLFLEALGAGNILDEAIVFIEDTREIWNHGHYFGGETIDPSIISDLQTAVAQMQSSKLDSSTAESTYAKKTELPSLDGYLTENAANALYVRVSDMQGISTVISNLQTEVSTKVEQSQLNSYVPLDSYESTTQTLSTNIGELNTTKADKATTIAGYGITDVYTKTESDARFTMLPITYSELVTLRDNSQLIPGQQYRITDYVTTTAQKNTKSAGHQFDVIVTADNENTLNEKARACLHEGDTYFADSDLSAWEIWYCLDNDEDRFSWAFLEELDETTLIKSAGTYTYDRGVSHIEFGNKSFTPAVSVKTTIQTGPPIYVTLVDSYTLTVEDVGGYLLTHPITVCFSTSSGKGVIYRMIDENGNDCPYDFKNIMFKHPKDTTTYPDYYYTFTKLFDAIGIGVIMDYSLNNGSVCYNNVIKGYSMLNNNVFINTADDFCYNNHFENYCRNNSFGGGCCDNFFGFSCYYNSFGTACANNSFECEFNNNSFGNNCYNNSFGHSCNNNSFGDNFHNSFFGNDCYENVFGSSCNGNSFGHSCSGNKVGDNYDYNSFGNNCKNNTFVISASGDTYRNNIRYVHLDHGVTSMTMCCTGTSPLQNVHVSSGVTGTVEIKVTGSARQINVYRINYGSGTAGTNAIDYGEWYKHVTTTSNINVYDRHIICDNTSAITLTLPTGFPGAEFYIHKRSAQSVTVTLASTGSQYISTGHSSKTTENRALTETLASLGTSKVMWDPSANEWLRIYMG